jgi:hypothetical protein
MLTNQICMIGAAAGPDRMSGARAGSGCTPKRHQQRKGYTPGQVYPSRMVEVWVANPAKRLWPGLHLTVMTDGNTDCHYVSTQRLEWTVRCPGPTRSPPSPPAPCGRAVQATLPVAAPVPARIPHRDTSGLGTQTVRVLVKTLLVCACQPGTKVKDASNGSGQAQEGAT